MLNSIDKSGRISLENDQQAFVNTIDWIPSLVGSAFILMWNLTKELFLWMLRRWSISANGWDVSQSLNAEIVVLEFNQQKEARRTLRFYLSNARTAMMDGWAKDALDRLLSMTAFFEGDDDRLTINVSGTHYEINLADLFNFPDTVLGDPLKRARYLVPNTNQYFFPRHSSSFESILYYYINDGVLIKPETVPALVFYEEIRFFQLSDKLIQTFYNDYLSINEQFLVEPKQSWRKSIWQTFTRPPITALNSYFSILSAIVNALAVFSLCLETINVDPNTSIRIDRTQDMSCSNLPPRSSKYLISGNNTLEVVCLTW